MISIEAFAQKHIQDAAELFTGSYRHEREKSDCLPSRFEKPEAITHLLGNMLETQTGVVAISDGKLVGYLTGYANIPDFKGTSAGVYVPEWAHSTEIGPGKQDVFQPMYNTMSHNWVGEGCFTHAVTFFPSDSTLRDLLYWSGFGLLVVDAIRATDPGNLHADDEPNPEIVIRSANENDLEELVRLDNELFTYLSRSPTFLFADRDDQPETAEEFLGESSVSIVAEREHHVLACIRGRSQKEDSCTIVQDTSVMGIDFAYTDADVRGEGIGRMILTEILAWGRARQKTGCAVDFESANVLGRAFWLRHFEAVCFSAIRHVDPRVNRAAHLARD